MERHKLDFATLLWLLALSFWSGVSYMQIQSNKDMIAESRIAYLRVWDKLDSMQRDLGKVAGYIDAQPTKKGL